MPLCQLLKLQLINCKLQIISTQLQIMNSIQILFQSTPVFDVIHKYQIIVSKMLPHVLCEGSFLCKLSSSRQQYQFSTNHLTVGNDQVTPVMSIRNLAFIWTPIYPCKHVLRTAAGCFAVLRRIKSIQRSLTKPVLQSLMVALVLSQLDYDSTVLFGLPQQLVDKLQYVQNAAARLTDTCCPSSRPHQPIAAGSTLAAGC